jgi:hypothetical protein
MAAEPVYFKEPDGRLRGLFGCISKMTVKKRARRKPSLSLCKRGWIALSIASGSLFRILKGIESDILWDGSLDYAEHVLNRFDFVVAGIRRTGAFRCQGPGR